jgi:hypothetical protein
MFRWNDDFPLWFSAKALETAMRRWVLQISNPFTQLLLQGDSGGPFSFIFRTARRFRVFLTQHRHAVHLPMSIALRRVKE